MIMTGEEFKLSYDEDDVKFSIASPFDAESDFTSINTHFADRPLDDLLQWSLSTLCDKVAQVTSFGPTGMVILDHLAKLSPGIRVITIDTNLLFEETYALIELIQQRYPIQLDVRQTSLTPAAQAEAYQPNLWQVKPDLCCHLRKVIPLREVLQGLDAWITGLRRDQSPTRANLPLMAWDAKYEVVKITPLAGWTRGQVWSYILEHNVPYNLLHDQGYASIGCTHCTRPATDLRDERSGRWQGQQKVECGIHI
jgi:phosphoadenosine phosphosulfate reductase